MVRVVRLLSSIFKTVSTNEYLIEESKGVLWDELQGERRVPSWHDDDGIRNRERTETKHVQPVTVV